MAVATRLSRVVMMVRGAEGVASAVNFYHHAVGLHVVRVTDNWAELQAGESVTLNLQAVNSNESQLSTGYSPWLTFEVNSMDQIVAACVQAGAHLDGPIQYPAHGKVAVIRSPDNHMIGLYEPALKPNDSSNR
jgi:catechol-2,3-dioxygenase